jgi:hypothetical protein
MFDLNEFQMNAIAGGTYVWPTTGGRVVIVHHVDADGNEWDEEVWEDNVGDGGGSNGGSSSDPSPETDKTAAQLDKELKEIKAKTEALEKKQAELQMAVLIKQNEEIIALLKPNLAKLCTDEMHKQGEIAAALVGFLGKEAAATAYLVAATNVAKTYAPCKNK